MIVTQPYIDTLNKLAEPVTLEISNEAWGILIYMRYGQCAIKSCITVEEISKLQLSEDFSYLIEKTIIKARESLIGTCREST